MNVDSVVTVNSLVLSETRETLRRFNVCDFLSDLAMFVFKYDISYCTDVYLMRDTSSFR